MKLKYLLVLLVLLLSGTSMYAQALCHTCGLRITDYYRFIEGYYYHTECFVCYACQRPIKGVYIKEDKNVYHVECLDKTKPEKKVKTCIICGKPFEDSYSVDIYQNRYHTEHNKEYSKCSNCGRLICNGISGGGVTYDDSRQVCNICYREAIFDEYEFNPLLKKILKILTHNGIDLSKQNIKIHPVDSKGLKDEAGPLLYNENLKGFCKSNQLTVDNTTSLNFDIYILNGLPSITIEEVMVHELMHAWIIANTGTESRNSEIEGICNFIAFRYLQISKDPAVPMMIRRLEEDPDLNYGKSFRDIRLKFLDKPVSELLDYVKTTYQKG